MSLFVDPLSECRYYGVQKRALDPLESNMIMSFLVWVLGEGRAP